MKRRITIIIVLTLLVISLLGITVATAYTANFKRTSTGVIYTINASQTSQWVGPGQANPTLNIRIYQAAYNSYGFLSVIDVDGIYGPIAEASITMLQNYFKSNWFPNIGVDGIVGNQTWSYIDLTRGWYYWGNTLPF